MNTRDFLFNTPLLELLRGRVGRLGWKRRVKASGLDADVQQTIRRIAGQWRLFRRERARIADELIAHFHDGGKLADFGDVHAARKLFRQTMIAKRGWWWPPLKMSAVIVLLLLGYYGVLTLRFAIGTPKAETDYIAKLRGRVGPPLIDGSGARLDALWNEILALGWGEWEKSDQAFEKPWPYLFDGQRAFLEEHRLLIDQVRSAAALPVGWKLLRDADGNIEPGTLPDEQSTVDTHFADVVVSEINAQRAGANILASDLKLAAEEGDTERALANIEALLSTSRNVEEVPLIVNGLVATGIDALTYWTIAKVWPEHVQHFSDAQLQQLAHQLASHEQRRDLAAERWMVLDAIQRSYTQGPNGYVTPALLEQAEILIPEHADILLSDGLITGVGRTRSLLEAAPRSEVERDVNAFFDRAEHEIHAPMWKLDQMNSELYPFDKANAVHLLLNSLVPHLDHARITFIRTKANRDGILVGIALELYHREHDAWPTTLEQLVPQYIPVLPVDPLTGEALQYRVTDDSPLVYSVGTDGDDDGGRPAEHNGDTSMWFAFDPDNVRDGDVPLWPPVP